MRDVFNELLMLKKRSFFILIALIACIALSAQHQHQQSAASLSMINNVEPQPLLAQAIRLKNALSFLGSSLSKENEKRLEQLQNKPLSLETVETIQHILDPYCLAMVNINPEARVK